MNSFLQNYLTASGTFPERASHKELTPVLIGNANALLDKVQALFKELGLSLENYTVSSGFRPTEVNAKTPNAAKKSLHTLCLAIDIVDDKNQTLAKLMQQKANLRKKYGIWLESPKYTKGKKTNWVHLDISTGRKVRDSMEFIPA